MQKVPGTPIINEVLNIVKAALSDNIFNHSMRTYLYANEFAINRKSVYSEEELLLVALFHDIGFYAPSYHLPTLIVSVDLLIPNIAVGKIII